MRAWLKSTALAAAVVLLGGLISRPMAQDYRVGPGDILMVKVMDQAAISGQCKVSPDGTISVPLLGHIVVKDMTVPEIEKLVGMKLDGSYLKYPVVTVTLEESHSRRFYVYGEVKAPGEYPLPTQNITVLQAVALAGGFTKSASETKLKLLRPKADKSSYDIIKVNMKPVLESGEGDEFVQSNDIIMVKEGWF